VTWLLITAGLAAFTSASAFGSLLSHPDYESTLVTLRPHANERVVLVRGSEARVTRRLGSLLFQPDAQLLCTVDESRYQRLAARFDAHRRYVAVRDRFGDSERVEVAELRGAREPDVRAMLGERGIRCLLPALRRRRELVVAPGNPDMLPARYAPGNPARRSRPEMRIDPGLADR
jgi:hypothetical protein